jgi:uncharacterized protein YukE
MAQAHADPERIRSFANKLWVFAQSTDTRADELMQQLGRLHESWKDAEYEKFHNHFQRTRRVLETFTEEVKKVVPSLKSDADKLQKHLDVTLNR